MGRRPRRGHRVRRPVFRHGPGSRRRPGRGHRGQRHGRGQARGQQGGGRTDRAGRWGEGADPCPRRRPPPVTDLADYTTLGPGGPARSFVTASTEPELIAAADAAAEPVLLIGGGSNLVIADDGFDGTVIHLNTRGVSYAEAGDGRADMTVSAGEDWDDVVAATVAEGLAGLECLS